MSFARFFRHSSAQPRRGALVLFLVLVTVGCAWPYGTITGRVRDAETGEALPGANVLITRTLLGASADANGRYQITRVPAGSYTVSASLIGYSTQRITIAVMDDSTLVLDLALRATAIPFDQVIVTGSRQAEELHAAAHSVSVLPSSEIRQRNRFRIDEALQSVPAVQLIGENVSVRGGTGYSLLGLGGSRVLMLIDDVPVLTSDLGRANWDLLPVTEVERVEVLKGAASVLYGSGGISGVVNVMTREPAQTPRFSFRQSAGIYDNPSVPEWRWTDRMLHFSRSDVSYTNVLGRLGFRLAVSRHTSTSDRENGDFSRWYFSSKSVLQLPDDSNLRLFLTYNRDARGFSLFWKEQNHALNTDFHDRINVDGFAASAIYNKLFNPVLAFKARLSYNAQLIGLPFNLSKDFKPALGWSGELQGNWLPHSNHNLTFGVDYRRDMVESKYYGEHQASAVSPYLQETWKLSGVWQLSVGARYDHYVLVGDSAETQISPKVGFSYTPLPNTILHASLGRGFRAPSIAERFSESQPGDNVRLFSNPVLKPERSTLIDAGVRQRFGERLSAEVTVFSNDYYDLIELLSISTQRLELQFRNLTHARVQGVEAEVHLRFWRNRLGLRGHVTYLDSRSLVADPLYNLEIDEALPYRPRWSTFVSPAVHLGPWTFEADYRHASRFEQVSFFAGDERVPQKVLDLRVRYTWRQFALLLQVKNAINYNYTVVERNLSEIRNFSLSLSGEW
ncbi:MAG: TonB-dependent receptor [candidate division KSB1 bacterium]|nr:TonB-dependent receptor [candidate division KSB1 bacterium]MDZ7273209.1 TonB-dependent receptor [candidate division KSB1 bacterium]MDZ7285311.1 TonB-dependent receptor [candidate division KSB1 bacterium]MDZ7298343.1 TonB-dependent receptor [candidate division KSB1 bacterium]MDZ7349024.1 TonB-dependent receptor [candidate division KSB1 bacterium]